MSIIRVTPNLRKDFFFNVSTTDTPIWTPATGRRFVITDCYLSIRNTALVDASVLIFDGSNASGNFLFRGNFDSGENANIPLTMKTDFVSQAIDNILRITINRNLIISGVLMGYERN